jgi:hypothetical protein
MINTTIKEYKSLATVTMPLAEFEAMKNEIKMLEYNMRKVIKERDALALGYHVTAVPTEEANIDGAFYKMEDGKMLHVAPCTFGTEGYFNASEMVLELFFNDTELFQDEFDSIYGQ